MKKLLILIILLVIVLLNAYWQRKDFKWRDYFQDGTIEIYASSQTKNGQSIYFEYDNATIIIKKLKAKTLWTEYIDNLKIYYCISPMISNYIVCKGKQINLQIATSTNYTVAGYPMIAGSF